jgi:hypothetical protein
MGARVGVGIINPRDLARRNSRLLLRRCYRTASPPIEKVGRGEAPGGRFSCCNTCYNRLVTMLQPSRNHATTVS